MKEISNQTLAVLLVVAIVASAGQTWFLMSGNSNMVATGAATGIAKLNVTPVVAISLPVSSVDFGALFQGASMNTTSGSPAPLQVQNDGGVNVNVSIARDVSSSALFSGTGGGDNTASFQFKVADGVEPISFNTAQSTTNWTNVPGTSGLSNVIVGLKYQDIDDVAQVHLLVNVPSDESPGSKSETLVFTASQA